MPNAVRESEKVPDRPDSNRAVNMAVSSSSTAPTSSLSGAAPCPTTAPSGNGRSGIWMDSDPPDTAAIGPQMYSAASMTCAPMSPSAPEPMPPWKRQVSGLRGSHA